MEGPPASRRLPLLMLDEDRFRPPAPHPGAAAMDPAIWGALPDAFLDAVVRKLPARTQAQCRALSRAWAALPAVPPLQATPTLPPLVCAFQQPGLDEPEPPPGPATGGFHGLVHHLDVTFLPPRYRNWRDGLTRVFAQAGLLCVAYRDWDRNELCICLANPHTRTWRELPPLDWRRWSSYRYGSECEIKVVAGGGTGGAGAPSPVLVLTEILYSLTTLSVFSSAHGQWTTTPHKFGLGVSMRVRRENRHAVCRGHIYGLVGGGDGAGGGCWSGNVRWEEMVVLDATSGQEIRRLAHLPHTGLTDVHLVEYRGQVVWVERDGSTPRIWVLGAADAPAAAAAACAGGASATDLVAGGDSGGGSRKGRQVVHKEGATSAGGGRVLLERTDDDEHRGGGEDRWEMVAAMPADLVERVRARSGRCMSEHRLRDVQLAGDLVFLNLATTAHTHVVAYHMCYGTWQLILHHAGRDTCDYHFLQPRLDLRL